MSHHKQEWVCIITSHILPLLYQSCMLFHFTDKKRQRGDDGDSGIGPSMLMSTKVSY